MDWEWIILDWEFGIGLGIVIVLGDWGLGFGIEIGNLNWEFGIVD